MRRLPLAERLTLSVPDVAALLGVSETKVRELVGTGALPSLNIGRRVVVSRLALEQWVARSGHPAYPDDAA